MSWQPSATLENLKQRAVLLKKIREFFDKLNYLEVETPIAARTTVTDPYLASLTIEKPKTLFLQTSPEFHMKRLLAAHGAPIYQIAKAFRSDETGRLHHLEFTLLEWYRPGYNHHDLMREMNDFFKTILLCENAAKFSYQEIFQKFCDFDPFDINLESLKTYAKSQAIQISDRSIFTLNKDDWLSLILAYIIEPQLGQTVPTFIYDYPSTQAALAKIREDSPPVAERFEVYYKGVELANGFHELTDGAKQRERMIKDNERRAALGLPIIELDEDFFSSA